ncbi:TCP-1/cpn60 chaperonin family protein [Halorussus sp. AFM4]|uniref:TCP-1/cpn60 chaperonin family protein n=1 Tax=Halorussus sp. AFM4 TaxID=3421651 RepID=UPI003EC05F80
MNLSDADLDFDDLDRDEWAIRDEEVRRYVEQTTNSVASLVRSTIGPNTLEKLVETHDRQNEPETVLTGDADEILAAIERGDGFNDPVAAFFVDAVDSMQRALSDGTGTAVVLADALVRRGLDLIDDGVHPNVVVTGYALAASRAGSVLDDLVRPCKPTDRRMLRRVAATSMTADITGEVRARYADQVAEAVASLAEATDGEWLNTDDIDVLATTESEPAFHRGVVVRRRPNPLEEDEDAHVEFDWEPAFEGTLKDAGIVIMDDEVSFERTATPTAETQVSSPGELERERDERVHHHRKFAEGLADLGVEVLVSQDDVEDSMQSALTQAGIVVVDRARYPKSNVYRLARATGATVVSHVEDVTDEVVGTAGQVHEVVHEDEKWTLFDECDGSVFTLIVPVELDASASRRERLVSDAVEVAAVAAIDRQILPGAGAPAAAVMHDLRRSTPGSGRERLAVEAFADALEDFLTVLARNAGLEPLDAIPRIRTAFADGTHAAVGLNLETGRPQNPWDAEVVEPRRVFSQALETARSIAEQLLTIDAVLHPGVEFSGFVPEAEHE